MNIDDALNAAVSGSNSFPIGEPPPIKQGGGSGRAKRDHALIVWHPVFQPLGIYAANSWDDMREKLRGTSYPEYMKDWTIQEWMDDGAVLVEIQRGEDAAVYSVEQPNFTTKDFRWVFDWLAYPEPLMPVAYFYAEHAEPEMMKFCDLVPDTVWDPETRKRVKAYRRVKAEEDARQEEREQAAYDELERIRREGEKLRRAGFPLHQGQCNAGTEVSPAPGRILACPFCGGPGQFVESRLPADLVEEAGLSTDIAWMVQCQKCGAQTTNCSEAGAARELWNKRQSPTMDSKADAAVESEGRVERESGPSTHPGNMETDSINFPKAI